MSFYPQRLINFEGDGSPVLSLTQPWASLVVMGAKKLETRSWRTNYHGTLIIHASKGMPKWAKETCEEEPFAAALRSWTDRYGELPLGHIIGEVQLIDVRPTSHWLKSGISEEEESFGDFGPGRYGWLFSNPIIYEQFTPAKGSLGLWHWKREAA